MSTDSLPLAQPPVTYSDATKGHGPGGPDPSVQLEPEAFPSVSEVDLPDRVQHARRFHTMSKASLRRNAPSFTPAAERDREHASDEDTVYDATHAIRWSAPKAPITALRRPAFPATPYAGTARAPTADGGSDDAWLDTATSADRTGAKGSTRDEIEKKAYGARGTSVLQKHASFFDRDGDGVIWPHDTLLGFRALGYGVLVTLLATFFIHFGFSLVTQPYFIWDPLWRIRLENIHRSKHGSSSGTYDPEGRFIPQKFDDIFSKYGETSPNPDGGDTEWIAGNGILKMLWGNACVGDVFGWTAIVLEWLATYLLLWPADGRLRKDDVLGIIDGTLFYRIRDARRARARKISQHAKGKGVQGRAEQVASVLRRVPVVGWVFM